jgi:hypothetical protein
MATTPQNFANHARFVPMFHFVTFGLLCVNAVHAFLDLARHPGVATIYPALLGVALVLLAWYARVFALTVQDRVIRLEMRLRIQQVAPHLATRFAQLAPAQVAALRFASDAELPGLIQQVLDGKLGSPSQIKRAVKDWQGDFLRA